MAGFGYLLSQKTVKIIYDTLSNSKNEIAFNKLEDTYLGHFLSAYDVKFVDIKNTINPYPQPNFESLHNTIIDHMYNNEKLILMSEKYKLHKILHQEFLEYHNQQNSITSD